ncbi:hypothetical protein HN011_007281 [Eciton burchellii]|nr:hypothetical protein HN011_007281 [Eciton burchellii]
MKCYYELLEVARDASIDDIKKAYRKLALKWHPDKNLDNVEEAKEQFQLIQQAWEILSDPHERTWYDNHREAILKGGKDYEDDAINLFPYFSATCFKGYGDDANGFYTIYRKIFEKLASEDAEFTKGGDSNEEIPNFGNSQSSYEDVVHNFYAYWQSYSTKKSYSWLDPYDIRNIPNRRIYRLVEKENKKVRDKAKRERNEQVRNLVAFIRKRDKRVQMYAVKLAERARENFLKAEERRKAHLLQRQKLLREQNVSEWSKFSNMEAELKKIETNLTEEFEDDKEDDDEDDALYCIACNKIFKTHKAFMNHENSRKHKEKINIIKHIIIDDDENQYNSSQEDNTNSESSSSISEVKLATNSQMPDFLLNPHQSESKQLNDNDNDDVSAAELISDNEDDLEYLELKKEKKEKNINTKNAPVATHQMENISFMSKLKNEDDDITSENELISDQEEDSSIATKSDRQKKKKKNKKHKNIQNLNPEDHISDDNIEINEDTLLSKKQRKKLQRKKATSKQSQNDQEMHKEEEQKLEDETEVLKETNIVNKKLKIDTVKKEYKREQEQNKTKNRKVSADIDTDSADLTHSCFTCSHEFPSKNKLFEHLKKTGHSIHTSELQNKRNQQKKEKASKKKDNSRDKKKH